MPLLAVIVTGAAITLPGNAPPVSRRVPPSNVTAAACAAGEPRLKSAGARSPPAVPMAVVVAVGVCTVKPLPRLVTQEPPEAPQAPK